MSKVNAQTIYKEEIQANAPVVLITICLIVSFSALVFLLFSLLGDRSFGVTANIAFGVTLALGLGAAGYFALSLKKMVLRVVKRDDGKHFVIVEGGSNQKISLPAKIRYQGFFIKTSQFSPKALELRIYIYNETESIIITQNQGFENKLPPGWKGSLTLDEEVPQSKSYYLKKREEVKIAQLKKVLQRANSAS